MADWRAIKRKARGQIHETFGVPAFYLTHLTGTPVAVNVRIHTKIAPSENEFTWPSASGFVETTPKIIFRASELVNDVLGKSYVIVSETEMYRISLAEPNREGFVAAECEIMSESDCAATVTAIGTVLWESMFP